jgi:hypothetical protein
MLKQTITYQNFDNEEVEETLYFNISKSVTIEKAEEVIARWTEVQNMLEGQQRDLEISEVKKLVNIVKYMMELSYGVRSDDGRYFEQSPELWAQFTQSAAFDHFLFSLFQDVTKCTTFVVGVFPKELQEEARKIVNQNGVDTRPLWEQQNRKPTPAEIQAMSKEEVAYAMQHQKYQA